MNANKKIRVIAPAPILIDRIPIVAKGDRGIILEERGNGKYKAYTIVFASTVESAGGYPVFLSEVSPDSILMV